MRWMFVAAVLTVLWEPAESAAEWVDRRQAGPFLIQAEYSLNSSEELIAELGRLKHDIETSLDTKIAVEANSIVISLFRNRRNYAEYLSIRVPEGVNRPALFVQGPDAGRVYAYKSRRLSVDVRHEATHALLHQSLPYVPLWLDEGLAEYFEVSDTQRAGGHPHFRSVKWANRFGWNANLRGLEEKSDLTEMSKDDYRDSWAWTHFLLHESRESRQVLKDYLQEIREDRPPGRFSVFLAERVPHAEVRLKRHFRQFDGRGLW